MSFLPRKCLPVLVLAVLAAWSGTAMACEAPRLGTADGCVSRSTARHRVEAIVNDETTKQGLKATTRMHFRIGSMAIPYLISVLLQLQKEGRLSLDDKLSENRPQLPDADRITLRELAENTSGYLDWVKAPASSKASNARTTRNRAASGSASSGLVKIPGGRKLFLTCRGNGHGGPTVVLISGFRGGYDDWTHIVTSPDKPPTASPRAVFPQTSKFTRVCAYDRPGTVSFAGVMSPSTPVRQPTTAADGAADLHALLSAAGLQGPILLVAHSWGAMIGRLYASIYPEEVAGLVLVDPGSEYLKQTLKPAQWKRFARGARKLGAPKTLEAAAYEGSIEEIDAAPPVPRIPAEVLTSDHPFDFGVGGGDTWPAWLQAQDLLAAELGAEHVTRTDSGHYIAGERPGLVVGAIRRVRADYFGATSSRP